MSNPYEPPASNLRQDKLRRQILKQLLSLHDNGGSFTAFLRMQAMWIILKSIPTIPAIYLLYVYGSYQAIVPVIGMAVWFLYTDIVYSRMMARAWFAQEQIIDWEKARELAEVDQTT